MKLARAVTLVLGLGLAASLVACSSGEGTGGSNDSGAAENDSAAMEAKITSMLGITLTNNVAQGIERGAFTDAGLDAALETVQNPPAALASLQGGNADFAYAPISTALTALSEGLDIKIIASAEGFPDDGQDSDNYDPTGVVINPESGITSAAELAGKTVAVPSRNGMMEITIAGAVERAGGDPSTIEWIALDQQSQVESLQQGRIDAAGLATPFTDQAEAEGMNVLLRPSSEFFEHGPSGVWITTGDIAKNKPELVTRFQQAITAVNEWGNANSDELAESIIAERKLDITPEQMVVGYFPATLYAADITRANDEIASLGYLTAPVDLDGVVIESN